MGSKFDDCIYWTSLLQLHLIITAHTLNSFLIKNLSLHFFRFSDWSLASSLVPVSATDSRNEITSCGLNIDHRLQGFHSCVSRMRCLGNPSIYFQATVLFLFTICYLVATRSLLSVVTEGGTGTLLSNGRLCCACLIAHFRHSGVMSQY
jgi:hypothetical protein